MLHAGQTNMDNYVSNSSAAQVDKISPEEAHAFLWELLDHSEPLSFTNPALYSVDLTSPYRLIEVTKGECKDTVLLFPYCSVVLFTKYKRIVTEQNVQVIVAAERLFRTFSKICG